MTKKTFNPCAKCGSTKIWRDDVYQIVSTGDILDTDRRMIFCAYCLKCNHVIIKVIKLRHNHIPPSDEYLFKSRGPYFFCIKIWNKANPLVLRSKR